MKLTEAPKALQKALRRLDPAQGLVARRNARRQVLAALSAARRALDEEFPRINPKARPTPKTFEGKLARWERKGYVLVNPTQGEMHQWLLAGIKVRRVKGAHGGGAGFLVPGWAKKGAQRGRNLDESVAFLKQLKSDLNERKKFLVEQALLETDDAD